MPTLPAMPRERPELIPAAPFISRTHPEIGLLSEPGLKRHKLRIFDVSANSQAEGREFEPRRPLH
jgi:hypothetical protein